METNGNGHRLTPRQELFCLKYFELSNATQAAIIAGYSPRTAAVIASENLRKPKIASRIQELQQSVIDESVMSILERKRKLTEIARGNLLDYQEVGADGGYLSIGKESPNTGAIAEITSRTEYDEKGSGAAVITKVRLHNPIQAIAEMNKMEHVYGDAPTVNVDSRSLTIVVASDEDKRYLERVINGERT
jgi:phage terminase small subunit